MNRKVIQKGESLRTTIDVRDGSPVISFEDDKVVVSQTTPPELPSRTKGRMRNDAEGRYKPEDMAKLPQSRQAAIVLGASRYFNGLTCKSGHIAPRRTAGGTCVECSRIRSNNRSKEEHKAIYGKTSRAQTDKDAKRLLKEAPAILDNLNEKTVTDRVEAAQRGLRFYYEAGPCVKGHTDKVRYTSTGQCVVCHRALCIAWNERKNQRDVVIDNGNLMKNPTAVVEDLVGSRGPADEANT